VYELNKTFANDSLIIADCAEPRLINELQDRGLNIEPAVKGADSVRFGIALIQDYDLVIDESSIDLIKELNNYCWLEKKSETPIDKYNHALDALRYAVTYQINENQNSLPFIR
jgi:phage terminase large subunit